jgi:hypothetical protein
MATSGNYTLSLSVNDAAAEAFDILQIAADGESLDGDMIARFKKSGNLILKEWQSQGMHLWAETEGTLFLKVGQEKYDIRQSTTRVTNEYFETTTTADTAAGVYTFSVTSADNIERDDTIGIVQSDNDLFWTTVTFINNKEITVKDPITLTTNNGAFVRNYRDTFIPISRVTDVRRREGEDYEIQIVNASREEYFALPNKEQAGTPIQAYYDRQDLAGEKYGVMYFWNSPISSVPVINFTYERKMQIMDQGTETLDLPEYAQEAFIYNVASKLILKYGASPERTALIMSEAQRLKNNMLSFDTDSYPVKIEMQRYG